MDIHPRPARRPYPLAVLALLALAAAGCGGESKRDDDAEQVKQAAQRAALVAAREMSVAASEAFNVRVVGRKATAVHAPAKIDEKTLKANVTVRLEVDAAVTPVDRDDGRRLAFPAQGHVRVPVTAKVPVTRDAHGQWGVYPDDVDLSPATALAARDAQAAGDAGAAAVARLLTFDGDERAYAEAAAQLWAVRSPTAELPASDELMPPPALKASGYRDANAVSDDPLSAEGPYWPNSPDVDEDDVPLGWLLADDTARDDGCRLQLQSLRPGRPTMRIGGQGGDLLQAVIVDGRIPVTASSWRGCQEPGDMFDDHPSPGYARGAVRRPLFYKAILVRPRWLPEARWYVAGVMLAVEPLGEAPYEAGIGDAGALVGGINSGSLNTTA